MFIRLWSPVAVVLTRLYIYIIYIYIYIRDVIDNDFIIVIIELIIIDYYRLLSRFKEQIMSFKMPQTRLF